MRQDRKTCERIHRLIFVYSPFIIVNLMIIFIYYTYIVNYLMLLIGEEWRFPFQKTHNSDRYNIPVHFYIIQYIISSKYKEFGIVLMVIFTWSAFWLIISYHRTCYSDPGYIPNPMDFEIKLLYSFLKEPNHSKNPDSLNLIIDQYYQTINEGSAFIDSFAYIADNGPLTQHEVFGFKKAMNSCLTSGEPLNEKSFIRETVPGSQIINKSITYNAFNSPNNFYKTSDWDFKRNSEIKMHYSNYKTVDINSLTLCPNCTRWKPERTHHCRQCNKCVLKMDHHCPWLANCIGFKNYKYFLLVIFYGLITSMIVLLTFWEVVIEVNLSENETILKCVWCLFAYICNIILFAFILFLFSSNMKNVLFNITTIEKADQTRFTKKSSLGCKKMTYKYNKGICNNLVSIFGRNPFVWFFPFVPNLEGEGIKFDS